MAHSSPSLRQRVHAALDNRADDPTSRTVGLSLQALIALNVLAVVLESVEPVGLRFATLFAAFQSLSMVIFTIEYVLRVWSAVEAADGHLAHPVWGRLRYVVTPLALIDLAALGAFYLPIFGAGLDLRWLRALRVVGILKFTRYSHALITAGDVARAERGGLLAAAFVFAVVLVLASTGIYAFEHQAQPEKFANVPMAMYWGVVTLTTLGYGDVVPITWGGRVFAMVVAFAGIAMVAFPSAILASGFIRQLRLHSHEIRGPGIEFERRRLKLTEDDMARIVGAALREAALQVCPNCGEPLDHTQHGGATKFGISSS
jgi:voltage-gated potassium channel